VIHQEVLSYLSKNRYREAFVCCWSELSQQGAVNNLVRGFAAKQIQDNAVDLKMYLEHEQVTAADLAAYSSLELLIALDLYLWEIDGHEVKRNINLRKLKVGATSYWLLPCLQQGSLQVAIAKQTSNLRAWVQHHVVVPCILPSGINVCSHSVEGRESERWKALSVKEPAGGLNAFIGHFTDEADVEYQINGERWLATKVIPALVRNKSLETSLHQAMLDSAHVVVFPEFTVDAEGRCAIASWLRKNRQNPSLPLLTIAGAFHEGSESRFNSSPVLNSRGEAYFFHRKLRLFGTLAGLTEM
jgi:hypothetical protein